MTHASATNRKGPVITIDGPAAAGKSTMAKLLAGRLGFYLLDTGALYRAVALYLIRLGLTADDDPVPESALGSVNLKVEPEVASMRLFLGEEEVSQIIRSERIGDAASKFSAKPEVRRALLTIQRCAASRGRVVAEGRDMGTVVFPDAEVKFFLVADLAERSRRRHLEVLAGSGTVVLSKVRSEMQARDRRDESREQAPLVKARDALIIDTTGLDPTQVLHRMEGHIARLLPTIAISETSIGELG